MAKKGKRSPFGRRSLPRVGGSLGDQALDLIFNQFLIDVELYADRLTVRLSAE